MLSGLRARVLLLIAVPFTVMLAMIVYASLADRERDLAEAHAQLMRTAELMTARQQRVIERARQILLSVALLPEIRGNITPETCSRALAHKVGDGAIFLNMLVARPDGHAICNAIGVQRPIDISDRDFFRRALQTHDVEVGGYIISRSTGKPAIGIAYPLLDASGRPQVVVSAAIDPGWMTKALAKAALPRGSRLAVAGAQGMILACYPDCADSVGKPAAQFPVFKTILAAGGEGTDEERDPDGVKRVFAFVPLYRATSGQVYLWIGVPEAAIVGPAEHRLVQALLVELGLLLLTFSAFWAGSRRLFLGPLASLGRAAAQLGRGDLTARVGAQAGSGEIAEAAQSFDRMAEALETKDRQLSRSGRALRMISAANQTMVHARDEAQLLEAFCGALVEAGGYRMAWIGYAENDARHGIRPVARAGAPVRRFLERIEFTWSEGEAGKAPAASAVRGGAAVVVQDIEGQPGPEPWRGSALSAGCGSCVALPLRVGATVVGVLAIYAQETGAFDADEVKLLGEAAGDLSYGIASLRGVAEQAPLKRALRTAEERLRAAVEANLDAILVLKSVRGPDDAIADFELVDLNGSAERVLGLPRDRAVRQRLSALLPEIERSEMFASYVKVATSGAPLEEEFSYRGPDGGERWLRQQVVPVGDGVAVTSRNVTAWKLAGERLRDSEETLRAITASAQDAVLLIDDEGKVAFWNPAAETMFGYAAQEVLGQELHPLLAPPRYHDAYRAGFAHFRTTGQGDAVGRKLEIEARRKDGAEFAIELSLSAIRRKDRWNAVGIVRDITRRKLVDKALNESRARLDLALRSAGMGVWHLDLVHDLRHFDAQVCGLLGIEPAAFSGGAAEFYAAVHPEDRASLKAALERTLAQDALYEPEYRAVWPDGSVHHLAARARLVRDERGQPARIDGVLWDVTERRRGQIALERANRALRTLSACNEALIHATSEAELLDTICRVAVETGGYAAAWVGFPEQDAAKTVRVAAQYGVAGDYLASARATWDDTERGRGPTGAAIRSGATQVNQNSRTNPAMAPWREAALAHGYHASIALPLKSSAGVLGALTLYAQAPDAFDPNEVRLLEELAADLAFGLTALRTRSERDRIAYEHRHHAEILRESLEDSIKAIAATVEMRDPYTAGHERRVAQLAVAIAREMGLPEETVHGIELAASIHDLGKINVPAEILAKPTRLSDIELLLVKNHAQAGYDILKGIRFPWPIAAMVLQHHERLDGSGYPQGLKDGAILPEARIIAVADVVEAMASHRPYRAALGIERALQEIERGRGTAYDPAVVDACLRLFAGQRFAFSG